MSYILFFNFSCTVLAIRHTSDLHYKLIMRQIRRAWHLEVLCERNLAETSWKCWIIYIYTYIIYIYTNTHQYIFEHILMTSSKENISPLLNLCAGCSPVTGEFPSQRPATRSFDGFFGLRRNKRLSKQSRRRRAHYDVIVLKCHLPWSGLFCSWSGFDGWKRSQTVTAYVTYKTSFSFEIIVGVSAPSCFC